MQALETIGTDVKEFLNVEFYPSKRYNIKIVSTYKTRWFRNNSNSVPPMVSNIQSFIPVVYKKPTVGWKPKKSVSKRGNCC